MKLTRHNGQSGKNGAYNPKHNDKQFDIRNSDHIDEERANGNIYWDCYQEPSHRFGNRSEGRNHRIFSAGREGFLLRTVF